MLGEEGRYGEWERAGIVPREVFARAGRGGFLGMAVPERYGGAGAEDFRFNLVIGEECQRAARRRASASGSRSTTTSACRTSCATATRSSASAGSPGSPPAS